ncbi:MAG: ornithine carbamoyltransferase [Bacillota bacterium]|nr:ornithine carbamoyltransferase [Bacillota bacterium]
MNKDLLKLSDLNKDDIIEILDLADQLKYELKHDIPHHYLSGKILGMIFQKSSTRTRVSFEAGMFQLGGSGMFLSSRDLQIGRGEPIEDTARVLSRYVDAIMIRTYDQEEVETLAKYSSIPIINGLTDEAHPCQVLADLMTIREYKRKIEGLKVCYIGDGNNMANSLMVGCATLGMDIWVACPKGYEPMTKYTEIATERANKENCKVVITDNIQEAAKDADVLITDVWASMGQEEEIAKRKVIFKDYQINENIMSIAKDNAIILHCLPAHKGEEITADVFEKHSEEIFDEAENRLHAQKAVLVKLISKTNLRG